MGGTGVIDHFLEVFTRYIDSGFGLLGGEVAFIATTLIVIDVTLAALFWSWGADDDIMARLVKKTLFVGVFAYIIGNWNNLARIVFESFAGLGLKASRHRVHRRRSHAPRPRRADRPRRRPAAARFDLQPDGLGSPSSRTSSRSPACCSPGRWCCSPSSFSPSSSSSP